MTWPTSPESIADIPHNEAAGLLTFQVLDQTLPGVAEAVCKYVAANNEVLEDLTQGDEEKERALGSLLIQGSYAAAAATSRHEAENAFERRHTVYLGRR